MEDCQKEYLENQNINYFVNSKVKVKNHYTNSNQTEFSYKVYHSGTLL